MKIKRTEVNDSVKLASSRKQIHVDLNCAQGEALKMISEVSGIAFRRLVIACIEHTVTSNTKLKIGNIELDFEEKSLAVLMEELQAIMNGQAKVQADDQEAEDKKTETKVVEQPQAEAKDALQEKFDDIMKDLNGDDKSTAKAEKPAAAEATLEVVEVKKPALRAARVSKKPSRKKEGTSALTL